MPIHPYTHKGQPQKRELRTQLFSCVGSLTSPDIKRLNIEDICETGPTVYSPYPRILESLTICK